MIPSEKIRVAADNESNQTIIYATTKAGEKEIFRLNAPFKDFEGRGLGGLRTFRNKEKSTTIQLHTDRVEIWDTNGSVLLPAALEGKEDLPSVTNSGYYDVKTDERLIKTTIKSPHSTSNIYPSAPELLYLETNTCFMGKNCTFVYLKLPYQEKKQLNLIYDNETHELHFGKRSLLEKAYKITSQNGQQVRHKMTLKEGQDAYFAHPPFNLLKTHKIHLTVGFDNRAHLETKRAQKREEYKSEPALTFQRPKSNYVEIHPGINISASEVEFIQNRPIPSKKAKRLKGVSRVLKYLGILHILIASTPNALLQNDKISDQSTPQTRQTNTQNSR